MAELSEAQRIRLLLYGYRLVPTHISWRTAETLQKRGWVVINPFYHRWLGRADITDAGRRALSENDHGQ
jgi:hypothetical protein